LWDEEVAVFSRLMMQARRDPLLVIALTLWRFIRDNQWQVKKSWHDGASRCTQVRAAQAFGVSRRTIQGYFALAQNLGLITRVGWRPTASGRIGLWKAEALPESVTRLHQRLGSSAGLQLKNQRLNEAQVLNSEPAPMERRPTTRIVALHGGISPLSPSTHPAQQVSWDVAVAERGQQGEDDDGWESIGDDGRPCFEDDDVTDTEAAGKAELVW
jgi:hypothetical protein